MSIISRLDQLKILYTNNYILTIYKYFYINLNKIYKVEYVNTIILSKLSIVTNSLVLFVINWNMLEEGSN